MSLAVPLKPLEAQTVFITLNGQNCQINVYSKGEYGMFLDLYVFNVPTILAANPDGLVIAGVQAQNQRWIVISAYLGFSGDLAFYDTTDTVTPSNPTYDGLGSRYQLTYYTPEEIAAVPQIEGEQ